MEEHPSGRLLGPSKIRQLASAINVTPTKKLGQNFVHDAGTVRKIASAAKVSAGNVVLEVGPGLGSLTLALLETGASVVAVEIDRRLAGLLPATVQELAPNWAQRLTVINQDALDITSQMLIESESNFPCEKPDALVANLPYNVAVPVLLNALAALPTISSGVVMVQKEVADRLTAAPGSRIYGSPTVKLAWYGPAHFAGVVGRKVFWPEPNVDSALVAFDVDSKPRGSIALRDATFRLVDAAFGQRRKMIRSSLRTVLGGEERASVALGGANLDGTERPEDLSIDDFVAVAVRTLELG